ncbi:MAG: DJ-1/PfpI family protein [Candidatus Diapherotrites archaeon]|nr:DJ-1/PfpI family protein [Candidatus Diapherotrites archaeon]
MKAVLVISQQKFRDEELFETKEALEGAGIKCVIASKEKGSHRGMLGATLNSEISVKEIGLDFDALVFIGGVGALQYYDDKEAHQAAKRFFEAGKIAAAICIAPVVLANAGILKGKNATVFPSEQGALISKGANYTGAGVEIDGKIITASGPSFSAEFGREIAKAMKRSNQ